VLKSNLVYEATTKYDEAAYRALSRLMLRKLRRMPRLLLLGLGILLIITGGWLFFIDGQISLRSSLPLLFGNFIMIFALFAEHFLVRLFMAENKQYGELVNLYQFYDEGLAFSNNYTKADIPYNEFLHIFDSGSYLFMFMQNKQAYILRKSEMHKGTSENLCLFLENRIAACREQDVKSS